MPYARYRVDIKAPVMQVFEMVSNQPERTPEWWPSIALQKRITPAPTVEGSIYRYVFDVAGVRIKGEQRVASLVPNVRYLVETISGVNASIDYVFEIVTGGTRVTATLYFSLPGAAIGHLIDQKTIEDANQRNLQDGLTNLKALIEREAVV